MSILREILTWSEDLPAWQSDAIARLFARGAVSDDDLDDLLALLKADYGIPDPKGRIAKRLRADQIPVASCPDMRVKLLAVKNLRHVNRIAENQRLPFAPTGLSVIYGDNGSGKSGYSRVLKRACRARDQSEPILPNALLPMGQTANAEGQFDIEVNGVAEEVSWNYGKPSSPKLSSLSVFDSRCARSYLDNEGDYAYVPYGLDILESLANVFKKLKSKLDAEQSQTVVDTMSFADLLGNTPVGMLIGSLSRWTKLQDISALATLTPEKLARHGALSKSLKEENPKERAKQIRALANRVSRLAPIINQKLAIVDDVAVLKLRGLVDEYAAAQAAIALAAQQFSEDPNLLPGTGGEAWKELFAAARRFSVEAFPGKKFPEFAPDSKCPLCQQPLDEGAERLRIFEHFIQQDVEKTAQLRKKKLEDQKRVFADQSVSPGMDDELFGEIEALDATLSSDVRTLETAISLRHAAIMTAIDSRRWDTLMVLPSSCVARLQVLAARLNQEAETLERLVDENARVALKAEFDELDARVRLSSRRAVVLTAIDRLVFKGKLEDCISGLKTNAISLKASELTEKVVSKELEVALNQEFKSLGVGSLQVCLKSRSDKGKAIHKLRLDLPQAKNPGEILSEGEQRAIAIGSFLAEVNVGGGAGGVIFDDPVSSLDHGRRERVARRLTEEAVKRQVIIFTHDIYFLNILIEEAKKQGVAISTQSVTRKAEGFGVAYSDLPFEGMNTKSRVGYLRNRHQEIQKIYKSGDTLEYRKQTVEVYRHLRIAWERAVEEVLLRQVVMRFRKGIETQRLSGVVVESDDYTTINLWMTKCSNYAHDNAILGGVEIPEPDELLAHINALDEWRKQTELRSTEVMKKRQS